MQGLSATLRLKASECSGLAFAARGFLRQTGFAGLIGGVG